VNRQVAPPSGMEPPVTATTPSGVEVDLEAVAEEVCAAYDLEFPDERERYGPAGLLWCRHDNQHLLNWAVLSLGFGIDFEVQLAWLARVLEARGFPLARFARDLDILAATVALRHPGEPDLHARLLGGAAFVRSRSTFLTPT
jgi:hypothetical protein